MTIRKQQNHDVIHLDLKRDKSDDFFFSMVKELGWNTKQWNMMWSLSAQDPLAYQRV